MSAFVGHWFENVWITPEEEEVTAAIRAAFDAIEQGTADHLQPDPFFKRDNDRPPLTDTQVDELITGLDEEYDLEMRMYANHHLKRSGATDRTEMHRLPPLARRYLAEQIDAIHYRHESISQKAPPRQSAEPCPDYSG